eukprot:PhF_6_TR10101/c0_g1_i2/m.15719
MRFKYKGSHPFLSDTTNAIVLFPVEESLSLPSLSSSSSSSYRMYSFCLSPILNITDIMPSHLYGGGWDTTTMFGLMTSETFAALDENLSLHDIVARQEEVIFAPTDVPFPVTDHNHCQVSFQDSDVVLETALCPDGFHDEITAYNHLFEVHFSRLSNGTCPEVGGDVFGLDSPLTIAALTEMTDNDEPPQCCCEGGINNENMFVLFECDGILLDVGLCFDNITLPGIVSVPTTFHLDFDNMDDDEIVLPSEDEVSASLDVDAICFEEDNPVRVSCDHTNASPAS